MSSELVQRIVLSEGCEWMVVIERGEEAYRDHRVLDDLATTLAALFPPAPALVSTTYAVRTATRPSVPHVARTPIDGGALVHNPQNRNIAEYNSGASALAQMPVHGLAVALCASEEDADVVVAAANAAPDVGVTEQVFTEIVRLFKAAVGRS